MRKTIINKIICGFTFMMSIMMIIVCIPCFSVQAKEQNPLYSYVDSKTDLCGFVDKNGKVVIDPAWYTDETYTTKFDFTTPITKLYVLHAK